MTTISSIPSRTGKDLRIKELLEHPNWKGEASKIELKQCSYAITKEPGSNRFFLLWLNKKEERISVPFWINTSTFQWHFENGQAHDENRLDQVIAHIFEHFKEKDV